MSKRLTMKRSVDRGQRFEAGGGGGARSAACFGAWGPAGVRHASDAGGVIKCGLGSRSPGVGDGSRTGSQAWHPRVRWGHPYGFTLIELLVVIGIIVLLIAILVPTLGGAKNRARAAQTQALMSQLSAGISGYYERFHAYPGPLSAAQTTGGNKISGSQNMMLGVTYGFTAPPYPALPGSIPIPGATMPTFAKPAQSAAVTDYASIKPDGSPEQLAAFFAPSAKQVFDLASIQALPGNGCRLPVVVDAFTDGLPILYYRRTVGVDTAANTGAAPGVVVGYYYDENREYTSNANMKATSGVMFPQNWSAADLNKVVSADGSTTGKVRGGFALISAGVDRTYGTVTSGGLTKSDDITIVGGD